MPELTLTGIAKGLRRALPGAVWARPPFLRRAADWWIETRIRVGLGVAGFGFRRFRMPSDYSPDPLTEECGLEEEDA